MTRYVRLMSHVWEDGDSFDADPEKPDLVEEYDTTCEGDEWSSAVLQAADTLREHGCRAPSSAPGFHPDMWYSDPVGSYVANFRTGGRRENSGHLYGFSEMEPRQVWQLLTSELPVT